MVGELASGHFRGRIHRCSTLVDHQTMGEREIASRTIGEMVMEELRALDEVAYVRFASVYRRFQDVTEFQDEIERLRETADTERRRNQMSLLPEDKK